MQESIKTHGNGSTINDRINPVNETGTPPSASKLAGNCIPRLTPEPDANKGGLFCFRVEDDRFTPLYCRGDRVYCRRAADGVLESVYCVTDETNPARSEYIFSMIAKRAAEL